MYKTINDVDSSSCVCALCVQVRPWLTFDIKCCATSLKEKEMKEGMAREEKKHGKSIGQTDKSCGTGAERNKNKIQKEEQQRKEDALLFS